MGSVQIRDTVPGGGYLAVDLRHVLDALGQRALDSSWRIGGLWSLPESEANPLEKLANQQQPVPGRALKGAADAVDQVIDGEFRAFEPGESEPWVIVEAVNSSYYTVRSTDATVLASIRDRFCDASEYQHEEG